MRRAPDGVGFVLSTAAIALLIFTIIEAPDHGWGSVRSIAGFAAGAVLLATFIVWERRVREPMLDVALSRIPRFAAASASVTIAFFALFGFIFLITQFFQFFKGYGPLSAGIHLLPVATAVGVSSVLGTPLAARFGTKLVVASGLAMMAAFYAWVSTGNASLAYGTIAVQMVLFRHGHGLHERARDGGDHGRRADREGRRRLSRKRHDAAARRHARRGGDRQRVRVAVRQPPYQPAPTRTAGAAG